MNITVLGLGAMGSRMAARLLAAGHAVTVYNRTAARADALVKQGARAATTPRAAVAEADVVIACVTDDGASRSVWLDDTAGALAAVPADAVIVESSTLTPGWMTELGGAAAAAGRAFLDAPVVGSRPQAEAGALVYLVGGDAPVVDRARPVLLAMGGAVHHLGPIGAGTVAKLCVNELLGVQMALLGEVRGLALKGGLDERTFLDLIAGLPVTAPAVKGLLGLFRAGDDAPRFPVHLVAKDLRYAALAGEALGTRTPLAAAAQAAFDAAREAGHGDENLTSVLKTWP